MSSYLKPTWRHDDTAYCVNCGQECKPQEYERPREYYDPPGSKAYLNAWRSPCCKDELSADPVSARCIMCGKCQNPDETDKLTWPHCENCQDVYCPECANEHFETWRTMVVCEMCKRDLTLDKGPDWEEAICRAEYLEDR